jgi:3-phosphoshikimate 1-carboxyvinyltransferase
LLLAAPYTEKGVEIEVVGELVSRPYVDITLDVMDDFGVQIERDSYRYFRVSADKSYRGRNYTIDGDVSSASYFWGAAAITRGKVITENIHPNKTKQGDIGLLDVFDEMGCRVTREPDRVILEGGELSGIDVDMSSMPDMVPTLATVALFAKGTTIIHNVAHLRIKESDRLSAVAQELGRIGGLVIEKDDGLIIHGREKLSGAAINTHDDHRIAMSLAMAGLVVPGIVIKNEACVSKSYPGFWDALESL